MNAPSKTKTQTFNLLSIGHRGVGKTVFMVGSYAEQKSKSESKESSIWFDCLDAQVQNNLNTLLDYIAQTGQYPPATMKITNFSFVAKEQRLWGEKELCQFRWWDIPGEICNNDNPNFQKMLMQSHGCCVFIDTYTLFNNTAYTQTLKGIIKQVEIIASLARQSGLDYMFAIILTKCDLLTEDPHKLLKIEENIRPLMARLDANRITYQRFYSTIPIVTNGKLSVLQAKGASAPLLWLAKELSNIHRHKQPKTLASGFNQIIDNTAKPLRQARNGFPQSMLGNKQTLVWGGVALASLLAIITALSLRGGQPITDQQASREVLTQEYERKLKNNPNDAETLLQLSKLYGELQQYNKAIPLMEKLVSQEPEKTDYEFQLAGLYALNGTSEKAEGIYQKALEKNPNDPQALLRLSRLYSDMTQFDKALPLMEKLVGQKSDRPDFLYELAGLYALNRNKAKEEGVYDRILKLEPDSILALTSKATLRIDQGDSEAARGLFTKAEDVASTQELKQQIRQMADNALAQPKPAP